MLSGSILISRPILLVLRVSLISPCFMIEKFQVKYICSPSTLIGVIRTFHIRSISTH